MVVLLGLIAALILRINQCDILKVFYNVQSIVGAEMKISGLSSWIISFKIGE